ncbi:MAG: porin family protein [Bacteroidota bacterium]
MKQSTALLITTLLFAIPVFIYGQGFAIKAGSNLSTWTGDDIESSDMRMGYQVGLYYRVKATEMLNIVPGIQFTQRGTQDEDKDSYEVSPNTEISYEYYVKTRMNYLDLPLTFEYHIDQSLYLMARPTLSILMNHNYSMIQRQCLGSDCTGSKEEDEFDSIKKSDFGIGLGMGYLITDHVALSIGYQWGLISMDLEGEAEALNRTLDFSLEYRF